MSDQESSAPKAGIVHLGLGAFFRAHGAIYIQEAMAQSGGDWAVTGVSMTSGRVRGLLAPNGFRYTAVEVSERGLALQSIDILREVLVAPEAPQAILDTMAAPATKIVSLTVTEKGYCRSADGAGIDRDHPGIRHDLSHPLPHTAPGFIVRALDIRRRLGLLPFTVLSLDNLPGNGRLTRSIVLNFAERVDPDLAAWIDREGAFPSTMVDRIVPATTPEMIARLKNDTGIDDPAAVFHEPFRQWAIEDRFVANDRPDFASVGASMVSDVEPFERMKLRMLNGTHSALAYVGSLAGHETVADAVSDQEIADFIMRLWSDEIVPTIDPPEGVDLAHYADQLMARYRNPEIRHRLLQIAMDGSQKLPQRILDPLFENIAAGRPCRGLVQVVAGWIGFLRWRESAEAIDDPLNHDLWSAINGAKDDNDLVRRILGVGPVFGQYPTSHIEADLVQALQNLNRDATASKTQGAKP